MYYEIWQKEQFNEQYMITTSVNASGASQWDQSFLKDKVYEIERDETSLKTTSISGD